MFSSDSEVDEVSWTHCREPGLRYNFDLLLDLPGSERPSEFAPSDVSRERSKVLEVVLVLKLVPERYDCQCFLEFSSVPLIDSPQGSLLRMCSMVNLRTLLFVVGDGRQCSIGTSGAACFATSSRGFLSFIRQIYCFKEWRYEYLWYKRVPSPFGTNHGEAIVLKEEKKIQLHKSQLSQETIYVLFSSFYEFKFKFYLPARQCFYEESTDGAKRLSTSFFSSSLSHNRWSVARIITYFLRARIDRALNSEERNCCNVCLSK